MTGLLDKLAEVISASSSKLGLVALMVILAGFLAYKFFEKRSAKTQLKVFGAFGAVLTSLAFLVLLLPEETNIPTELQTETSTPNPEAPEAQPPEPQSLEPQPLEPQPLEPQPLEPPPPPLPPPPVKAWIPGIEFRKAVERAGGVYRVVEEEDACDIYDEGEWVVARVKAGFTGNKCEFQLQYQIDLDDRCHISEWDFDQPKQSKFKWLTQPRSGIDPRVHFRMWADFPPGSEVHMFLRRVLLTVPASTTVRLEQMDAAGFFDACLS